MEGSADVHSLHSPASKSLWFDWGPHSAPGRTQNASVQAVKAFQDFYPTVGLSDDMMVMLPQSGDPRARQKSPTVTTRPGPTQTVH